MTKMLEVLTAEEQRWLASRLYEHYDACDTMLVALVNRNSTLTLVTDASVQSPHGGIMTAYAAAQQHNKYRARNKCRLCLHSSSRRTLSLRARGRWQRQERWWRQGSGDFIRRLQAASR